MKTIRYCMVILGILLLGVVTSAQESDVIIEFIPQGINDPRVNEIANACYFGGSLSGKCDITDVNDDNIVTDFDRDWMWQAGWHLIRWQYNLVERSDFEPTYQDLLPPDLIRRIGGRAGCYGVEYEDLLGVYIMWEGGSDVRRRVQMFFNSQCINEYIELDYVIAIETFAEADFKCKEQVGLQYMAEKFSRSFYQCVIP